MTLEQIDSDIYIASQLAFKASTPDRRLAGAEWLQQLATELMEVIKAEQPQTMEDAYDDASQLLDMDGVSAPGWRILADDELPQVGDQAFAGGLWFTIEVPTMWLAGGKRIKGDKFRRRVESDSPGDGWRWLEPGEVIGKGDIVTAGNGLFSVTSVAGCKVAPGQYGCYRTKI